MRILFQYFSGGGGGLSNIGLLLGAYARKFPSDEIIVVCSHDSPLLVSLVEHPNVFLMPIRRGTFQELIRFRLGVVGINNIAHSVRADIIWSINLGSYFPSNTPSVLSVNNPHQVYPWVVSRFHPGSRLRVAFLRFFYSLSARAADALIVQTPLMASYLKLGVRRKNFPIFVIPKAVEKSDDVVHDPLSSDIAMKLKNALIRGFRLWLFVATALPHKNHRVILDAFEELRVQGHLVCLVLTITEDEAVSLGGPLARDLITSGRVIALGWVGKRHLRALYEACGSCVMPSVLESLSSSHLEAMEWECPQIVADLPYARDLCGPAAIYVDPQDKYQWADAILLVGRDIELRTALVNAGRERISTFPASWSECAMQVRDVFQKLTGYSQMKKIKGVRKNVWSRWFR